MASYIITTDNMADLPESYLKEHNIMTMSLTYLLDGVSYTEENSLPEKEFYAKMRAGSMPTTSQVNVQEAKEKFLAFAKVCPQIVHIAFSGGLSGTYNSAAMAAKEIMEEDPSITIRVVDSLCASLGEGLFVHKAVMHRDAGMSMDELVSWLEENKLHVCHNFTVDTLFPLFRGGRVSRATAIVGTMLSIKPMLHVDNEGKLINIGKVRGRKKSLIGLVDAMEQQIGSWRDKNDVVFISHGDCEEDANFVRDEVEKRFGIHNFLINYVGPTIGAHSGPGTLALFYMGDVR